jgi:TRAP-type C4-dicarboxylate transport system permease small subunit
MIDTFMKRLLRTVQFLTGLLFTTVFLVSLMRILLRNMVGITWFWIDGFSRLTFIWTVFLGATVLYATDDHLMMPYFVARMKPRTRKRMDIAVNLAFLVLATVLVTYGYLVFKVRMRIPYTAWNFPTGYAYLAAPVCGLLMILFCLHKLWQFARGGDDRALRSESLQKV